MILKGWEPVLELQCSFSCWTRTAFPQSWLFNGDWSNECWRPHKLQKHMQVKLNTDDSPGVATEYGIRSIPTIMLFKGGKRLDTIIGAVPKDNLLKTINKITN